MTSPVSRSNSCHRRRCTQGGDLTTWKQFALIAGGRPLVFFGNSHRHVMRPLELTRLGLQTASNLWRTHTPLYEQHVPCLGAYVHGNRRATHSPAVTLSKESESEPRVKPLLSLLVVPYGRWQQEATGLGGTTVLLFKPNLQPYQSLTAAARLQARGTSPPPGTSTCMVWQILMA